jgi:hypothetical protein
MSLVNVVCCQVKVSASGCSLIQRSLTECGVSECGHESTTMRRPWPTRGCCAMVKNGFTKSMKQTSYLKSGSCSAGEEILKKLLALCGTRKFITVFSSIRTIPQRMNSFHKNYTVLLN